MTRTFCRTLVSVVVVSVTLAACSGGSAPPSSTPAPSRPSSTAKITVLSPESGSTVTGPTVPVSVSLKGGKIVPAATTEITPSTGHLHVSLDGQLISMNYGLEQDMTDVAPGTHTLRVEFVAADHAPFEPRDFVDLAFRVKAK